MIVQLVTPPVLRVVEVHDLMEHLRVTGTEEAGLLDSFEAAAVAHLDGWTGVLGRAIRPQTWRQEFGGWGCHALALPDVTAVVSVTAEDADGVEVTGGTAVLRARANGGWMVDTKGADGTAIPARVWVTYTCALPASLLPTVEVIVKMLVGHWFENRTAVSAAPMSEIPMAAQALIGAMRWRWVA